MDLCEQSCLVGELPKYRLKRMYSTSDQHRIIDQINAKPIKGFNSNLIYDFEDPVKSLRLCYVPLNIGSRENAFQIQPMSLTSQPFFQS